MCSECGSVYDVQYSQITGSSDGADLCMDCRTESLYARRAWDLEVKQIYWLERASHVPTVMADTGSLI